jgi:hypothetical protein
MSNESNNLIGLRENMTEQNQTEQNQNPMNQPTNWKGNAILSLRFIQVFLFGIFICHKRKVLLKKARN